MTKRKEHRETHYEKFHSVWPDILREDIKRYIINHLEKIAKELLLY